MNPDRAILLTPPGSGAIAVIRLIGPRVGAFLESHVRGRVQPGRCAHVDIVDARSNQDFTTRTIDDAVIVIGNESGIPIADLNVHGGPWVVRSVMDLAARFGFSIDPPPGDKTAALPGTDGTTLLEQEMLASLPLARTELGIRVLLKQPSLWEEFLHRAMERVDRRRAIEGILADRSLGWLLHPPTVAIIGWPNAGKSTLANQLFGQERSITADVAGTTRDWIGELANIDGLPITLVDTPGLRSSDDAIEQAAIALAKRPIEQADLVVILLDATRPLDEQMRTLPAHPTNRVIAVNKVDLAHSPIDGVPTAIPLIAVTGHGVDELRGAIRSRFGLQNLQRQLEPKWWTSRQRDALVAAVQSNDPMCDLRISIGLSRPA